MLVIIGVGLPLYWIVEPGRQAGAVAGYEKRFAELGRHDCSTPRPTAGSTAPAATAA